MATIDLGDEKQREEEKDWEKSMDPSVKKAVSDDAFYGIGGVDEADFDAASTDKPDLEFPNLDMLMSELPLALGHNQWA
ncbi:MAG: hypothetical protein WCG84_04885 [Candidatus Moraniibacteriota bacterium]